MRVWQGVEYKGGVGVTYEGKKAKDGNRVTSTWEHPMPYTYASQWQLDGQPLPVAASYSQPPPNHQPAHPYFYGSARY